MRIGTAGAGGIILWCMARTVLGQELPAEPALPEEADRSPAPVQAPSAPADAPPPPPVAPAPAPIRAATPNEATPPPSTREIEIPEMGVDLDGSLGGGKDGMQIALTALFFTRWLEAGVSPAIRADLFGPTNTLLTGLVGLKMDQGRHIRFEVLAEAGSQSTTDIGRGLFSTPIDDVSVTLPYVGARLGLTGLIGRKSAFILGGWLQAGGTTGKRDVTVRVEDCFLGCFTETETHTIGGSSWSLGLRLGGQLYIH